MPIFPTDMDTQFGTGADPDMFNTSVRWPLIMTTEEKQIAKALCDLIIPEDTLAPSASAVGTVEFIDEWTSAPYPEHVNARLQVGNLLQWLNQEAAASYRKRFDELALFEQRLLCDRVCDPANAAANLMTIAECFSLFRFLVVGAYFTSPAGIKFIDYLGNTPTFTFGGPPPEVLRHLGLVPEI